MVAKHAKESRFGLPGGQKIVCFPCIFEHKVNRQRFLEGCVSVRKALCGFRLLTVLPNVHLPCLGVKVLIEFS